MVSVVCRAEANAQNYRDVQRENVVAKQEKKHVLQQLQHAEVQINALQHRCVRGVSGVYEWDEKGMLYEC